jgi:hypothetical protein
MTDATSSDTLNLALTPTVIQRSAVSIEALNTIDIKAGSGINFSGPINFGDQANLDKFTKLDLSNIQLSGKITLNDAIIGGTFNTQFQSSLFNGYGQSIVDNQSSIVKADIVSDIYGRVYGDFLGFQRSTGALSGDFLGSVYINTNSNDYLDFNMYDNITRDNDSVPNYFNQLNNGYMKIDTFSSNIFGTNIQNPTFGELKPLRLNDDPLNDIIYGNVNTDISLTVNNMNVSCTVSVNNTITTENYNFNGTLTDMSIYPIIQANCLFDTINSININKGTITDGFVNITTGNVISGNVFIDFDKFYKLKGNIVDNKLNITIDSTKLSLKDVYLQFPIFNFEFNYGYHVSDNPIYLELKMDNAIQYLNKLNTYYSQGIVDITNNFYSFMTLPDNTIFHIDDTTRYDYITTGKNRIGGKEILRAYQCTWGYTLTSTFKNLVVSKYDDNNNTYRNSIPDDVNGLFINGCFDSLGAQIPYFDKKNYWILGGLNKINFTSDAPVFLQFILKYNAYLRYDDKVNIILVESLILHTTVNDVRNFIIQGNNTTYTIGQILPQHTLGWATLQCNIGVLNPDKYYYIVIEYQKNNTEYDYYFESANEGDYIAIKEMYIKQIPYNINFINTSINTINKSITGQLNITTPINTLLPFFKNYNFSTTYSKIETYLINFPPNVNKIALSYYNNKASLYIPYQGIRYNNKSALYGTLTLNNETSKQNKTYNFSGDLLYMNSNYYKYTWNVTNRWSKILSINASNTIEKIDKYLNNNFLIIQNSGMNNLTPGETSTNLISFFTVRTKFVKKGQVSFYYVMNTQTLSDYFVFDYSMDDGETYISTLNTSGDRQDKWNYSSFIFEKGDYIFRWYYKKSLISTIKVDYIIVSNILINDLDVAIDSQNNSTGINILGNVLVKDYYQRDVNLTLPIFNGVYGFQDNEIFMGISSNIGNLINNQNAYRYDLSNNYYADNVIYSIFTQRMNTYIKIQNQGILKIDNTITQIDKSNKCWRTETDYQNRKVYLYAGNKHSPSLNNSLFDGETAYLIIGPLLYHEFPSEYYIKFNLQCQTEKDYDIFFINYYDFNTVKNGEDIINNYFEKNPYKNVIYNHSGKLITPLPVSCYQENIPANLYRYYVLTYKKDLSNSYQLDYVQIDSLNFEFYKKAFSNDGRFFGSLNNSRNGEAIIDIYGQGTFKSIQTEKLIIKRKESNFDSGIINRYDNYIESDLYVAGDIIANFASRDGKNIFSSNVLIKGTVEMEKSMYIAQNLVVNGTITRSQEIVNNFITSPIFSLHKLQEWPVSDYSSGFHIEDATGLTGFFKTNYEGDGFMFKVPNRPATVMIYPDTEVQSNVLLDFHPVSQRIRKGNLVITDFISANIRNNSGNNFIYGNVIIDRDQRILGNIQLSGLINANIRNNSGLTSLFGNMFVEQNLILNNNMIINGNITSNSNQTTINNDLLIIGNLNLNKDINVQGLISSNIRNLSGRNHIYGNTDIDKNLSVLGNISGNIKKLDNNTFLFGNLFITDNLKIFNNLDVDNDITISNSALINNELNVLGYTDIDNDLSVSGNISGNIKSIYDNTYLFGNMFITDTLQVYNDLNIDNNLHVLNNTTIDNELFVSGNTYLNDCAIIANDCIVNSNFNVNNNSILNSVDVLSDIHILGNIHLPNDSSSFIINNTPILRKDTLGDTVLYSSLNQVGNLSNLTVIGNTNVSNLTTSGIINITSNTSSTNINNGALVVNGGVAITENLNIGSELNVFGNIVTTQNIMSNGNIFIDNQKVLDNSSLGNTILYSNLVRVGNLEKLDVAGNLLFSSNVNAIAYNNAPFLVRGGMAISRDLYVSSNIISKTFDTQAGETLSIANSRAAIINIASGTTAQTVNIGRSNTQPKEIYIGTGVAGSKIFIGSDSASVVIKGNTQYTNATNLLVTNKNIYLNENAIGNGQSYNAGIYIRDNNDDLAGYIITNEFSNGFKLKAPNSPAIFLNAINSGSNEQNTVVLNYNTSALNTENSIVRRDGFALNIGTINSYNDGTGMNLQHVHEFGYSVINWTRGLNKNKYAYIGKPEINSNIFEINTEYEVGSQIKITPGVYGILLNSNVDINGNCSLSEGCEYFIANTKVLGIDHLGLDILYSNLNTVGSLTSLDVLGNINFNGALYQNGMPFKGSLWEFNQLNNMYYIGSYVGINTNNPQSELDVDGNINISESSHFAIEGNVVLNRNSLGNNIFYSNLVKVGNLASLDVFGNAQITKELFVAGNIKAVKDINVNSGSVYRINNTQVLSSTAIGNNVINSNLNTVGNLLSLNVIGNTKMDKELSVLGNVNVAKDINLNLGSVYRINNTEILSETTLGDTIIHSNLIEVGDLESLNVVGVADFLDEVYVIGNVNVASDINLEAGSVYRIDDVEILSDTTLADCVIYSNLNTVGDLENLNVLGNVFTNTIDTEDINGVLNLATHNAGVINIGSASCIVNILSNLNYIQSNILEVYDNTITLNKGTVGPGTARGSGIHIRDNDLDNQGFITVNNLGTGWSFKAPENSNVLDFQLNNFSNGVVKCNNSQITSSILTISEIENLQSILDSKSNNSGGNINGNINVSGINITSGNVIKINNLTVLSNNTLGSGVLFSNLNTLGNLNSLTVKGAAELQDDVFVSGTLYVASNVNLNADQVYRIDDNEILSNSSLGQSVIFSNLNTVGNLESLTVLGVSEFLDELYVSGNVYFASDINLNAEQVYRIDDVEILSNISLGSSVIYSNLNTLGNLESLAVLGISEFQDEMYVWGNLNVASDVNLNADQVYRIDDVEILSNTSLGSSVINSNLNKVGNLISLNVIGNINFNGALNQNGSLFKGSMWETNINNTNIYYSEGSVGIKNNNPQHALDIGGNVNITDISYYAIAGNSVINKNTLGNTIIFSNLNTVGNLETLAVIGIADFLDEVYVSGNLNVASDVNINYGSVYRIDDVEILSETTLADCVINSNLNTVGNLETLAVVGIADFLDEVYVSGNVNVSNDINLNSGSVYRIDDVEILSDTTLADCVINSNLNTVGNLETLAVIGIADFLDEVYVSGNVNVSNDINLNSGSVYRIDDVEILSETTLADCVIYSNLTTVGNLENLNVVGYIYSNIIDTYSNDGTLNIGNDNASILNIGTSANVNTINIGTGIASTTINIGGTDGIVNLLANVNYIQSNNLEIYDNTITLNKGSTGSGTARGSGIHIRDNDIDDQGYITVNSLGTGWLFKSPENASVLDLQINNFSNGILKCNNSQITSSILTISEIQNLQTILDSKSDNSGGTISGNLTVSGINLTAGNVIKIGDITILSNTTLGPSVIYSNLNTVGNLQSLTVIGAAEFQDEVYVSGSVNVASNVNLNAGSVFRIDDAEILSNTNLGSSVIYSNLNTLGNLESLTVVGAAEFQDEVYVSGSVNVASNVNLNAGSLFRIDDIDILSNTNLGSSVIYSNLNTVGNLESLTVFGAAEFQDEVYVSGSVNVASNVNLNAGSVFRIDDAEILSNTNLGSSVIYSNLNTLGNLESLTVVGAAEFQDNLNISGIVNVASNVNLNAGSVFRIDDIEILSNTSLGSSIINSNLNNVGNLISLNVIGNINFNGALNQNGNLFKGSMWETNSNNNNIHFSEGYVGIMNNNPQHELDIGGNINITDISYYAIAGNSVLNNNTLGDTIIYSNLNTIGNLESLTVIGTADFLDEVYVSGNVNVASDININSGSVYKIDDIEILSETTLADCVIYSNLNTVGNLESITVIGTGEFLDELYVSGNVNVVNDVNLNAGSVYRIDDIEILSETTLADCVLYSNLNTVGDLENLNVLGNIYSNILDTYDVNGTLDIGTTNASIINIGSINSIVNILSNVNYIQSNILEVDDNTITLNKGSVGSSTARGSGIHIRDNDIDDQGYIIVNNFGTGWLLKAPEHTTILDIQLNNFSNGILKCNNSQITSAILTIAEIQNLQNILDSKSDNTGGTISGNLSVSSINLTSGNLISIGNVNILSNTTLGSSVIYSNLNTLGNLENLTVIGTCDLQDDVYISGNLYVSSDVNLNAGSVYRIDDVEILSNTTLAESVIYSNLNTVGNLESLTVIGACDFQDEVYISGNVNVVSDVNLNAGSVYRIDDVEILSDTTLAESVIYSNLNTVGNLESLTVIGACDFQDEVYISGNVNVVSDVNINAGSVYRIDDVEILSNTTLAESVLYSNLNTVGNLENLKVIGNISIDKEVSVSGNINIGEGSVYRINGTHILSNTHIGTSVLHSNLNTVGNLENLKVIGNVNVDGNLYMNKSIFVNGIEVYFSPWVMTNSNLYYNSGAVAIGKNTFSPNYILDIGGNVRATSYNSISDYRIKAEVETIKDTSKLHEINPVAYYNKINNRKQYGFIAHELSTIYPELVDGEKDGKDHQSIDYISIIALLIKEVQSLKKELNNLKIS